MRSTSASWAARPHGYRACAPMQEVPRTPKEGPLLP